MGGRSMFTIIATCLRGNITTIFTLTAVKTRTDVFRIRLAAECRPPKTPQRAFNAW